MTNSIFLLFFISSFFLSTYIQSEILSPSSSAPSTPNNSPKKEKATRSPHNSPNKPRAAKQLDLNSLSLNSTSPIQNPPASLLFINKDTILIDMKNFLDDCTTLFEELSDFQGKTIRIEGNLYNSTTFKENFSHLIACFDKIPRTIWVELKIKNINGPLNDIFSAHELIELFNLFAQIPLKMSIELDACDFSIFDQNVNRTPSIKHLLKPFKTSSMSVFSGLQKISFSNNSPDEGFTTLSNLADDSLVEFFNALSSITSLKSLCFSTISWITTSLDAIQFVGEILGEMRQLESLCLNQPALSSFENGFESFFSNDHRESKNKIKAFLAPLAASSLSEFGLNYLNDQKPNISYDQEDFVRICLPLVAEIKTLKILNLNTSLITFYHEDTIDILCSTFQSLSLEKIILTNNRLLFHDAKHPKDINLMSLEKICSTLQSINSLQQVILSRICISPCQEQLIRRNFKHKGKSKSNTIIFV